MYLQHRESQKGTDKAKSILFYALWVLYAVSAATCVIDILKYLGVWRLDLVSVDDYGWLALFQLVVQNIEIMYPLQIIETTLFACCDFIAQFILVRTTDNAHHLLYSFSSSKDISLLDHVELQHSCCYRSFFLSTRILRSINLSIH